MITAGKLIFIGLIEFDLDAGFCYNFPVRLFIMFDFAGLKAMLFLSRFDREKRSLWLKLLRSYWPRSFALKAGVEPIELAFVIFPRDWKLASTNPSHI